MDNINATARCLVEAYFGLSPQDRLSSVQKRAYPKLFNASRHLLEFYMKQYGLDLDEAAGHLDKDQIEHKAGISYTPADEPPKAVSVPIEAPKVVKKEQTMDEYIELLLADYEPPMAAAY